MDAESASGWSYEAISHHYRPQSLLKNPQTSHWSHGTKAADLLVSPETAPRGSVFFGGGIHSPRQDLDQHIFTPTHTGLSKIKISRVVSLHLQLIGSSLHSDLLAKWPCQLQLCPRPPSTPPVPPWDSTVAGVWEAHCPEPSNAAS